MTATRVVTDHEELDNIGNVTHEEIDSHLNTSPFLLVSGVAGIVPTSARKLVAGSGISISDGGAGGDLTISSVASTGSLPAPNNMGELLFAVTVSRFAAALPITTQNGWLVNNDGYLLVSSSL